MEKTNRYGVLTVTFDFELVLVTLASVSGLIWAVDKFFLAKKRAITSTDSGQETPEPIVIEYANSLFPVFLIVLLLRSFIGEPYEIPSGSMKPTLLVGDYILVSKFSYGVRLPVIDTKLFNVGHPQRGDVFVFRYPEDNETNFIKRVVGIPGDQVRYINKTLYINGEKAAQMKEGVAEDECPGFFSRPPTILRENLLGTEHNIYICGRAQRGALNFNVPEGHYLAFGDNRDNSNDSRGWGYVPEKNLVGKAQIIWFSSDASKGWFSGERFRWNRIGTQLN